MPKCQQELVLLNFDRVPRMSHRVMPSESAIGIWWADQTIIVGLWQSAENAEAYGHLLDSSLEHWREWLHIAVHFDKPAQSNYFDVPRGRVLLEESTNKGIVYHGNETNLATLLLIANAFHLEQYQFKMDEHYLTGAAADELFIHNDDI